MANKIDLSDYEELEGTGGDIWIPTEPNEALEGKVVERDDSGEYGTQWVIELEDGSSKKTPSHKMLQNKMEDVLVGDQVVIVLVELRPVAGRESDLRVYRVFRKPG